jgi:hypothetical protein
MKIKLFLSACSLMFLGLSSQAQEELIPVNSKDKVAKPTNDAQPLKYLRDTTTVKVEKTKIPVVVEPTKNEISPIQNKANVVGQSGNEQILSPSKPATRIDEPVKINAVNYVKDDQISDLDNLLNLIEVKTTVNLADNASELKSTKEYSQLLIDITTYRTKFDNAVLAKSIENCNTREQNFFLAFLKEEGKMDDYNYFLSKIK